ncbi:hypothetical protein H8356DRAFT_1402575 [Neocallimastix lanati (nom. inval.)]|nr:hypothetical protein H8356DRAFT_1402575 [Neocallimastix sp. JGI-2020a]
MVQINDKEEAEPEKVKPIARITQPINQVIDNQRIKDTVYDLTRQFYRERGIEYTHDYYDYLVDYNKWADWFKVQKVKNLKESKINKNPTEKVGQNDSQKKGSLSYLK